MNQLKRALVCAALVGLVLKGAGCTGSTDIPLKEAPPVQETPPQPVPEDVKKGGGPGSSGHMKYNPGGDT